MYNLENDIGEKLDVFDQNPEIGLMLKKTLEEWLISTNAKIPEVDPIYDEDKEKEWLSQHKIKVKEKVEDRRMGELQTNYEPNIDWWGSLVE